eukprot:359507_1
MWGEFRAFWLYRCAIRQATFVIGCLYPTLATAKAAVRAEPSGFVLWAPYWAVCGLLLYLSPVLDAILSPLVPLYPELKFVFVVWLTLPRYQGASRLCISVMHPRFEACEEHIDEGIELAQMQVSKSFWDLAASLSRETSRVLGKGWISASGRIMKLQTRRIKDMQHCRN